MSKRNSPFLFLGLIVLVSLACNMSQVGGAPQPAATQASPAGSGNVPPAAVVTQPVTGGQDPVNPAATPILANTPTPLPSHPIGLRQGLAGMNSYRMQVHIISNGPTESDKNDTMILTEYNKEGNQLHTRSESTTSSQDSPQAESSITEQYRVGDKTCSFSPSDSESTGTIETLPSSQETLVNGLMNLFDVVVSAENPVLVGAETVNGIAAYHYTFKISGLATVTGAEVTNSDGEYWIAQESQYLVKYSAKIGAQTAPAGTANAEIYYFEVAIEMQAVDTPLTVTLPAQCQ